MYGYSLIFQVYIYLKRLSKAIHQPLVIFSWRKSAASNSFMTAFGKNPSHPWDSYIFTYIKTININQKCRYDIYHTCILWVNSVCQEFATQIHHCEKTFFGVNTQFEIYNPPIFFRMGWDSTNLSLTTFPAPWEKFRRPGKEYPTLKEILRPCGRGRMRVMDRLSVVGPLPFMAFLWLL